MLRALAVFFVCDGYADRIKCSLENEKEAPLWRRRIRGVPCGERYKDSVFDLFKGVRSSQSQTGENGEGAIC